jgi:hypothetical protein
MRNISDQALAFLSQQQGIEPLNIVEVSWTDTLTLFYCDKTLFDLNIPGKIVELANLDNVVNLSGSTSTQSVSVTLDDIDGSIKNIYNTNDIHKRPVRIWQYFNGLNFNDRFLLFAGVISSPIVWKEGDRTFSFEVLSKLEDMEVGFSPEEGAFDDIPDELIGKAWPLPFGTVLQIPALKVDPIPAGMLLDPNGVVDPALQKQITDLGIKILQLMQLAQDMFNLAADAYQKSHFDENGEFQLDRVNQQYEQQGDQYVDQGNQYLVDLAKARIDLSNLIMQLAKEKTFGRKSVRVSGGECFPQNQTMNARMNGILHTGSFNGNTFNVDNSTHPDNEGIPADAFSFTAENSVTVGGQNIIQSSGFRWVPAGVIFRMDFPLAVRFVVSMVPATVLNVWAYRNMENQKVLIQVPREYYGVQLMNFGTITATVIVLTKALSHRDTGWDDSLYVDVQSTIGPNVADILTWIITNYSTLGIDAASFELVREQTAGFPCNFCMFDRQNIVQLVGNIAHLARCAIYLVDNVFHLVYLPAQPTPVDTIVKSDIILNTLEVSHTETEGLVTRLIASYKTAYSEDKPYKIVLRNNITKYGLHTEEKDWFIYNSPFPVDLAATFWLIRQSNTWKILHFRTPLHKLRLETFDAVVIDFPNNEVASGPVIGIIQGVKFDSSKLELEFEVWLPVRMGEMSTYSFAWPVDSDVHIFPEVVEIAGPGYRTFGNLAPINSACLVGPRFQIKRHHHTRGNPNPGAQQSDGSVIVSPDIGFLNQTAQPNFTNNPRVYRSTTPNVAVLPSGTYPAQIVSGDGPKYKVKVYNKGLTNPTQNTFATNVDHKSKLDADTWIMVVVVTWQEAAPQGSNNTSPRQQSANYFLYASTKSAYPGKIISGSGQTYQVQIFKKGLDGSATTVSAKQLQIDPADQIPAESWALVLEGSKSDGSVEYYIQVPIWLE